LIDEGNASTIELITNAIQEKGRDVALEEAVRRLKKLSKSKNLYFVF
jgi:hypothetical protein